MEKTKLLMVDDEKQFRETTSKVLTRRGFDVTVAGTGEEAIEKVKQGKFDVVVLDIRMPGMDGHEALEKIKKIDPKAQVIMLTGHGGIESAKESLSHGAFDYLSKPCDIDLLASKINDAASISHKGKREEKRAKDIMIPIEDYTTIGPDSSVRDGIEELRKSFESTQSTSRLMITGHRSILVMGPQGELTGILSILDLIEGLRPAYLSAPKPSMADAMQYSAMFWAGLFSKQAKDLAKKKVRDVMSPPPPTIGEETNLMEIANLLFTEQSRRLVVMRGKKVLGVVREQEIFFEAAHIILGD